MKAHITMAVIVLTVHLLSGCGSPEKTAVVDANPRTVRVETIASQNLPILVNAVGRLAPDRQVVLSAQVSGILTRYDVDVGGKVSAGQRLVTLDDADYALALSEARANLSAARVRLTAASKAFERARRLLPEKAITPELFDRSEAEFKSYRATVAQLESMVAMSRRRLEKTVISAPFDGYVTKRFVEIGQNVAVGDPLMNVAGMKSMRVKIYINELDYVHLDAQDPVTVTVEAFSQAPIQGRVDKIGIQADARTNTFEVEVLVDNPDFKLKAGLTARVSIQTEVLSDVVMIAQNALIYRESKKEVFVIGGGDLAEARQVSLGRVEGSRVRIIDGLRPGDKIVTEGGPYLNAGDKVVVAP